MPRSQLTREVFRRLSSNQPILRYEGCLRALRDEITPTARPRAHGKTLTRHFTKSSQCSSLLKLFSRPRVQDQSIEPGLGMILQYVKLKRLDARLPTYAEVEAGLNEFLAYRLGKKATLSDEHARAVLEAIKYLDSQTHLVTWTDDIDGCALDLLPESRHAPTESHRALALHLYAKHVAISKEARQLPRAEILRQIVKILCATGVPGQARGLVDDYYQAVTYATPKRSVPPDTDLLSESSTLRECWLQILKHQMQLNQESNMHVTLDTWQKYTGTGNDKTACAFMAQIYARRNSIEQTKSWFENYKQAEHVRSGHDNLTEAVVLELYESLFEFCARNELQEWGQALTHDAISDMPAKAAWDLILVWAAQVGKGIDQVEAMMDTIDEAGKQADANAGAKVDIATINLLLKFAIARNDPYMAERYVAIGKKRGLEPDANTLRLQMEYRLSVGDISGALTAYKNSQSHDLSDFEDVPAINRIISAMCASGHYDFESIMDMVADVAERQAKLSRETIGALAKLHLERGERDDVHDLLSTYVVELSSRDREKLVKELVRFITKPEVDAAVAWDTYEVLQKHFPAMDRHNRTLFMLEFFRRQRSDLAVHIFNGMHAHGRPGSRATAGTYISCLDAIALAGDIGSLQMVHNRFNLDDHIEANTILRNAFMSAYIACDGPARALRFWDDIAASREGPDMRSITLALKACETAPLGVNKAREIWAKLKHTGLELTDSLWDEYLGAVIGAGRHDIALSELDRAWEAGELPNVQHARLAALFNASGSVEGQRRMQTMIRKRFPEAWASLETAMTNGEVSEVRFIDSDRLSYHPVR